MWQERWIEEARRGEREGTFALVRYFEGMAYAVAYDRLRDAHLAEDAVQEAFAEAFRQLHSLREPAAFPGWFRVIVQRRCARMLRRRRHPETALDEAGALRDEGADVPELVLQRELRQILQEAVAALPEHSRVPVQLFYFQGLALGEISAYLETPVPTLKKRLFDARRKLRNMLPVADPAAVFRNLQEGGNKMLHIVNGDVVAELLKQGGVEGEILVWREIYPIGPVFEKMEDETHRRSRADALERLLGIPAEFYSRTCREQERRLSGFRQFDEVVLWFEHDLFDQTMLAYLLHWFAGQPLGETVLSLLSIGSYPGVKPFRGLGQLSPQQLKTLAGTWQTVGAEELRLGGALWKAYASEDPAGLLDLLNGNCSALPFARSAFSAHLERLPSVRDGLGSVERTALRVLRQGPMEPYQLFGLTGDELSVLGMGDLEFWQVLNRLGSGPEPLLHLEGCQAFPDFAGRPDGFTEAQVSLTEAGERALAGEITARLHRPGELWYGGLQVGGGKGWRWDEEGRKPVRLMGK